MSYAPLIKPKFGASDATHAKKPVGSPPRAIRIGAAHSPSETAADAFATAFVSGAKNHVLEPFSAPGLVQRAGLAASNRTVIPEPSIGEPPRSEGSTRVPGDSNLLGDPSEIHHQAGTPLPADLRSDLERFSGSSAQHIRVHNDDDSQRTAQALHSRAFALDNHIAFNRDYYSPTARPGRWLIAHEVGHVLQAPRSRPRVHHVIKPMRPGARRVGYTFGEKFGLWTGRRARGSRLVTRAFGVYPVTD